MVIAILVLVIIFWYGSSKEVHRQLHHLNAKGVEWITSSSGKIMMSIFIIAAVLLLAFACSSAASGYSGCSDKMKSSMMIGLFILVLGLILAGFILFFTENYESAYYVAIITMILTVLAALNLALTRRGGAALAMAFVAAFAGVCAYVAYQINSNNKSCHKRDRH
jgi:tryptophan-rich sensory protein